MRRSLGRRLQLTAAILAASLWPTGCEQIDRVMASIDSGAPMGCIFIGLDISGSFLRSRYFDDSLDFLAHYIYGHMKGKDGLEVPHSLFVGTIGGTKVGEPKTFYPIQTFANSSVEEIKGKLHELFPKKKENPFTDFNAFFQQIATLVETKKLILKPISIVLVSDGQPDIPGKHGDEKFRSIDIKPLEKLSRNVTIRLIYTDAVVGSKWVTKIPRRRIKFWTQDAAVMVGWKDPKIMLPGKSIDDQTRFYDWVKDNVDFPARLMRVD
jgi:hypothetical protein